jgi:hypothetical protein
MRSQQDPETPSQTHTKTIYEENQTGVNDTNKIDTDGESRGHVKGDNGSNLEPLRMKDIDGHGVQKSRCR